MQLSQGNGRNAGETTWKQKKNIGQCNRHEEGRGEAARIHKIRRKEERRTDKITGEEKRRYEECMADSASWYICFLKQYFFLSDV